MKLTRPALLGSLLAIPFIAFGASTDLSQSPLSGATSTEIRPNILFVLDDSKSMEMDALPDWADVNIVKFPYRKKNPSFNGIAYNPAIRYLPPSYVNEDGSVNKTTYPSQTQTLTENWTKVKDDGYGVQYPLSSTSNLVDDTPAHYYTTIAGEYCTDKTLKKCTKATAPAKLDETITVDGKPQTIQVSYGVPAKLRWCKTEADAKVAVASAGACQAVQISDTGGFTAFTYPRMPAPRTSTLEITGVSATAVSSVKVDTSEILPAATASLSSPISLAIAIANEINKCTYSATGACTIVGYRAVASGDATKATVVISAPGDTSATPAVTVTPSGSMTVTTTAFDRPADNLAPGENLLTVIKSGSSYPKPDGRTDCAGTNCTYEEEMTNYANWWAYYRTRMQAMKTAVSRSFEPIGNKYRIGYYSINNNTNSDFRNISEFDGTQKKAWYDKLFAATPYPTDTTKQANTPLRAALSNAGRLYAGKLTGGLLNGEKVVDPLQYYCQPNVVILSTDGYWNGDIGFKEDGTPVGDQDGPGLEDRPMLDAGAGEMWKSTEKVTKQRVPTAETWIQHKTEQIEGRAGKQQQRTFTVGQTSTSTLQIKTAQRQEQNYQLQAKYYVDGSSSIVSYLKQTATLQKRTGTPKSSTYQLQKRTKTQMQKRTGQLQSMTAQQKSKIYQLQQRLTQVQSRTSSNTGSTWTDWSNVASCTEVSSGKYQTQCQTLPTGGWTNAASCTVNAGNTVTNNPGTDYESLTYNTKSECQYTEQAWTDVATCTAVAKSTASPYTVGQAVDCDTVWPANWSNATSCTTSATNKCQYAWTVYEDVDSCTAVPASTGSPYTVANATECLSNQWTPYSDTDTQCVVSGTVNCQYRTVTSGVTDATCPDATAVARSTASPYTVIQAKDCTTDWTGWGDVNATATAPATCTAVTTGTTRTECQYLPWSKQTPVSTCTALAASTGPNYTGPATICIPVYGPTTAGACTPSATVQCAPGWTAWTDIAGTCTATTTTDSNPVLGATQCQYRISNVYHNVASCTPVAKSTGSNYTVNQPVDCKTTWPTGWSNVTSGGSCTPGDYVQCQYTGWTGWANGSCPSIGGTPQQTTAPFTVTTATKCQTTWTQWADVASCTPEAGVTECQNVAPATDAKWIPMASCTPNGALQECRENPVINEWSPKLDTPSANEPRLTELETCTEGTSNTGLITHCRKITPSPSLVFAAESCEPNLSGDEFGVQTFCTQEKTGPTSVDECTESAATKNNDWTSTTCKPIAKGATKDTLADVAEYYWKSDLRTPGQAPDVCTGGKTAAGTTTDVCADDELTPRQFMTTYTLGLGASGVMQFQSDYKTATSGDFYSIKTAADAALGNCTWQRWGECNWPKPVNDTQTNIDDLWHAAVNGRGTYFSAADPSDVSAGISSALQSVTEKDGALAAVTVTAPSMVSGSTGLFQVSFTAGSWAGDVKKYTMSISEGSSDITLTQVWSAQSKLNNKSLVDRKLWMFKSDGTNKLATFEWGNLSDTQKAYFERPNIAPLSQFCSTGTICLSPASQDLADAQVLVDFLRGDRTNEGLTSDTSKYFRQRTAILGDIVGSEAVYVKASPWPYTDTGHSAFRASTALRAGMVYVGANDGMLHAFKEDDGDEAWAYVPGFVMANMYQLADKNYSNRHRFFVDGTPVMGDICTANCGPASTTAVWKTILVGGANLGGRGYYAIDITDPANPKGLWEFTNDNLGYSYGNPVITKLIDGTWVVLVASGYNNTPPGDGQGRLFILNADTGAVIDSIGTGTGSGTDPSGLAKISAWVNYPSYNNTAQRVYGGDLLGNLWRFDINGSIPPDGKEAKRLATLKDASNTAQPITSRPELGLVNNKPVVFVGTGQLLGASDLVATNSKQSIYAIKDPLSTDDYGNPRDSTNNFVKQTMTTDADGDGTIDTCPAGKTYCVEGEIMVSIKTKNEVDWATKNGWYVDLPVGGERINTDMTLLSGSLIFTTNTPQSGACVPAGISYTYALDYLTGGYVEGTNGFVGFHLGDYLSTHPALIKLPSGDIRSLIKGDCPTCLGQTEPPIAPPDLGRRRVSWRELVVE